MSSLSYATRDCATMLRRDARHSLRYPAMTISGIIVPAFLVVGDSEEDRSVWRERARVQVAFYGSTPNYAFIFEQLDREDMTDLLREHQRAGDVAGMAAEIDDDLLGNFDKGKEADFVAIDWSAGQSAMRWRQSLIVEGAPKTVDQAAQLLFGVMMVGDDRNGPADVFLGRRSLK